MCGRLTLGEDKDGLTVPRKPPHAPAGIRFAVAPNSGRSRIAGAVGAAILQSVCYDTYAQFEPRGPGCLIISACAQRKSSTLIATGALGLPTTSIFRK